MALVGPAAAHAQTTYVWTRTTNNGLWSDTANWSGGLVGDGAGNTANFATLNIANNRNVNLDSPRTIGIIQFGDTSGAQNWTLLTGNSSALTMDATGGTPPAKVRGLQNTTTISVVLDGTSVIRFVDSATGVLVLNAANIYTGNTEISRNILRLGVENAIPSGSGFGNVFLLANVGNPGDTSKLDLSNFSPTINGLDSDFDPVANPNYPNAPYVYSTAGAGTSTLTVGAGDANGEFGGEIRDGASRTLALTKIGTGTQTLTNANPYTGPTTINGGTLRLSYGGSIANSASITVGAGATFDVSGVNVPPYAITFSQTLNGSGGTGTINGDLTLDPGAGLTLTYAAGAPTITVTSNLTLNGNAITVNVAGSPLGDGSYKLISKSGSGAVAGTPGTLTVAGLGIVGGGAPSLSISGGELFLDITGGATIVEWGSGDGTWAVGTSGWNSGGATTWANGYAALFTDTYSTGNPTITLNTEVLPQSVIVSSTKIYTISGSGDIGGSAELRMLGPGALTLGVANAHTGGSTLFDGALNLGNASALGAASGTFTINGGTLDNTSGGALTTPDHPLAWNGSFVFTGSSDLNLGAGAVTLGSTCTVSAEANTLTAGGDVSGAGFGLVKAGAGTLALNGVLGTDSGTVTVNAGTLTLGGDNTFTGGVTINDGELILNHDGALNSTTPNTVVFQTDADVKALSLNGHSVTIPNLAMGVIGGGGATEVRNGHATTAVTLTVDVSSGSVQYAATLADGGAASLALTKSGAGNWTFGGGGVGSGTYSGDTTINNGTITAGANNVFPFGAGKGNMIVQGTLDILDRSAMALNGLFGGGIVNRSNPGGAPICTLTLGNADASGAFSGRIRNTGTGATLNLVKTGTGTQTLSGANTYSGTTIVSSGALLVNSPGSLHQNSAVTVNAGATIGGSGTINGPVTIDANGTISAGASAGILTLGSGLTVGASTTNVWELAANDIVNTGGTNFDQIALIDGPVTLDGTSELLIQFTGTATSPDLTNSFWQYPRQWKVIEVSGTGSNPGPSNFGTIDGTNGITAGTFTTTGDASGVTLVYTPSVTPPAPTAVTAMNLASVTSTNYTLSYSGGTGSQFVLVTSLNVDTPLILWTPIGTNIAFSGAFDIQVNPVDPQAFYRIISE